MTELQPDPPTPGVMMVEVINHIEGLTINEMFDGVPVSFPPEVQVDVSAAVAAHVFGYPGELADRALHMAKRFGWSGKDYLKPEALGDQEPRYMTLAKQIEIRPIFYDLVRRDPNAPIPLDTGDEADDRPQPPLEADTTTRVGKRKRAKPRTDRHRTGREAAIKLGSR